LEMGSPDYLKTLFTNTEAIYPSIKQVISNNVYCISIINSHSIDIFQKQ